MEHLDLGLRQGVHATEGWLGAVFQVDLEVVEAMVGKGVCPVLAEYISILVVFLQDARHIGLSRSSRGRSSVEGWVRKRKLERDRAFRASGAGIGCGVNKRNGGFRLLNFWNFWCNGTGRG